MRSFLSGPGIRSVAGLVGISFLVVACSSSTGGGGGYGAPAVAPSVAVVTALPSASAAGGGASGSGDDYSRGSASPAASAAASPAAASPAAGGRTVGVAVATGAPGSFLTGQGGMTLYVFTPDSANTSTCSGGCAAAWPPFRIGAGDTLEPDAAISGALTTFAREDGSLQVAHDGAPLYYFASDANPGDATGQGASGKWFVAAP